MATIITKNSSTASSVPLAAQLVQGELAVNVTDKRLFTENSGGTVVELGTNPSSITNAGNLAFTGTGNRITGDFSNATVASRVMFQTSTTNGNSVISAIPNGTSGIARFIAYGNSDPTNTHYISIDARDGETSLRSETSGSGTYQPLFFVAGGAERMRIDSSGNVGIGTSSPSTHGKFVVSSSGAAATILTNTDVGSGFLQYYGATGRLGYVGFGDTSANLYVFNDKNANLIFGTNGTERARIASTGQMSTTDGTGAVALAYDARAWVRFNGTGTIAILGSGNVSSITDGGAGTYTVNFTTAMPDANYNAVGMSNRISGVQTTFTCQENSVAPTASAFRFGVFNTGNTAVDSAFVSISIFR